VAAPGRQDSQVIHFQVGKVVRQVTSCEEGPNGARTRPVSWKVRDHLITPELLYLCCKQLMKFSQPGRKLFSQVI